MAQHDEKDKKKKTVSETKESHHKKTETADGAKSHAKTPAKPEAKTEKAAGADVKKDASKSALAPKKERGSKKKGLLGRLKSAKKESDEQADADEKGARAKGVRKKMVHKSLAKPKLDDETKRLMTIKKTIDDRRPDFNRQEWFRYKKLSRGGWRAPRGKESKMRRHFGYRPNVVSIGFRSPAAVRDLHPSGFEEVRVFRPADLEGVDPQTHAIRIARQVGTRKRLEIEKVAAKLKIRVLN